MFKIVNKAMAILCYLPYLYLFLFYSFVLRAIVKLGRIPSYDNPDPKTLGFNLHRDIIYKAFDWVMYGLIVFAVLLLLMLFANKFTVKKAHWICLLIGIILIIVNLTIDPLDEWFLD